MTGGNQNYGLLLNIPNEKDLKKVCERIGSLIFENHDIKFLKEEGATNKKIEESRKLASQSIKLEKLLDSRLYGIKSDYQTYPEKTGNLQYLMIMMGISILIVILSIINYVNMATANAINRAKEIGVRKILGATKSNIIWQFLFETLIISLLALILALSIVELTLPFYNELLGKNLDIHSAQFFSILVLIVIIILFFAGLMPAWYIANFETLKVLKGNFSRSKSGIWLRNSLLVLQFSIATIFLVGSYLVKQQVDYLATREVGFRGSQIMTMPINFKDFYDKAKNGYNL
jgi:putative ABC transport system permease protein